VKKKPKKQAKPVNWDEIAVKGYWALVKKYVTEKPDEPLFKTGDKK
jgi:hypothetical protein